MLRLGIVVALAAVIVALVAVIDHRHKREVEFAAQEAAWFCAHGRPSSRSHFDEEAYEQRWENREFAYRASFFAFSASALGLGMVALRRRYAADP